MSKTEVIDKLVKIVEEKTGKNVTIGNTQKNNGVTLTTICIESGDVNVVPIIYIDDVLDRLEKNMISYEVAADQIISFNNESQCTENIDVNYLISPENIRSSVIPVLVNVEKNKKILKDWVNTPLGKTGLTTIYKVVLSRDFHSAMTITLTNQALQMTGMTAAEVNSIAIENMRGSYCINLLGELLKSHGMEIPEGLDELPMFVLSSFDGQWGASVLLYPNYLRDLSDFLNDNLLIIPSSIHEVLVLPYACCEDINHIKELIPYCNTCEVNPTEVLGDNPFLYDKATGKLSLID